MQIPFGGWYPRCFVVRATRSRIGEIELGKVLMKGLDRPVLYMIQERMLRENRNTATTHSGHDD